MKKIIWIRFITLLVQVDLGINFFPWWWILGYLAIPDALLLSFVHRFRSEVAQWGRRGHARLQKWRGCIGFGQSGFGLGPFLVDIFFFVVSWLAAPLQFWFTLYFSSDLRELRGSIRGTLLQGAWRLYLLSWPRSPKYFPIERVPNRWLTYGLIQSQWIDALLRLFNHLQDCHLFSLLFYITSFEHFYLTQSAFLFANRTPPDVINLI